MEILLDRLVVLKKKKVGEVTEVLVLGESAGKLWVSAPAVAQSRKRFPGGLELFTLYEAELSLESARRKGARPGLNMARPLKSYPLTRDMAHFTLASRMTEIVEKLTPTQKAPNQPQADEEMTRLFPLLLCCYASLETMNREQVPALRLWFQWRLLIILGYALNPFRCAPCDTVFDESSGAFWLKERMGIFCRKCLGEAAGQRSISLAALRLGQKLVQVPVPTGFGQVVTLPAVDPAAAEELRLMLDHHIRELLPRPLKTEEFDQRV